MTFLEILQSQKIFNISSKEEKNISDELYQRTRFLKKRIISITKKLNNYEKELDELEKKEDVLVEKIIKFNEDYKLLTEELDVANDVYYK